MNFSLKKRNDFMKKAAFIADKSTCNYKIGCVGVIEDKGQEISPEAKNDSGFRRRDGYVYLKTWNERLPGEIYCQGECIRVQENLTGSKDIHKVCSIHAEVNLIAKCAKYNIPTNGMTIFITNSPCYVCAKSIIVAGISQVFYMAEHTDTIGVDILKSNGVKVDQISNPFD